MEVLVHLLIFALFGALLLAAVRSWRWRHFPADVAIALLLAATLGAATEFAQLFVAERTASVGDWVVDLIGALLGMALVGPLTLSIRTWRMLNVRKRQSRRIV